MLTEVCTGENICNFKEESSGLDFHCPVESLPLSEQLSESFYMRDNDSPESVDVQNIPEVDAQEGSLGVNLTPAVETLSVSQMLANPSCNGNDDFSKSVDAQDITGNFQEGSSDIDLKCNVEKICVSHQLSDPSWTENNDFSNDLDSLDFSGDFWEGSSAFDITADVEKLLGSQPLSDVSCTENEDLFESVDARGPSGIDVREGSSSIDPSPAVGKISGSDPSCTENDDFSEDVNVQYLFGIDVIEGSSAIDPNSTVGNIPRSDPSCTENDDLSKSVDEQELSGIDVREGSSAMDRNSTIGNIPGTNPPCIENDDFPNSVYAQDLVGIDVRERSSAIDPNPTIGNITGFDSSCIETDDFSKDVNAQDLSGADFPEGSCVIDEKLLVNQHLSDPSSTENNDMSKTVDAQDLSRADLQKVLFPVNFKSTAEISKVSEQLFEPSILNDDFSKNMDSLALPGADFSEQLSTVDLDSDIMKLSVSQQLPETPCAGDINVNKSMDAHLRGEDCVINNTGGSFGQSDNGGKGCIMVDGTSAENLADIMCVSPRKRSLRKTRSRQNAQTAKPTRSQRNLTNRKMSVDFNSFQITRRRRSYVVKRARSSVWGSLTSVQVIEQNDGIESHVNEHKKTGQARGGQARGKKEKNQSQRKNSNKKNCSIAGSISSKGKIGEGVDSSSIMDAFPIDINVERHFKTKVNFPDLANDKDFPRSIGSQGCKENLDRIVASSDDSVLDFCHAGKDPVENFVTKTSNDCQQFMSGEEVDKLKTPNDSMGLDPGTSPDSEVINLNLDAPLMCKGLEDLHDILSSSQVCDASEDAMNLIPMRKCIKKGKKKKNIAQPSDCSAADELMNSEIMANDRHLMEVEQVEKGSEISSSADASATTANASGNTSSTEGISKEPLCSRVADLGMSRVTCKVGDSEINLSTSVGTEFESSVSEMSKKVLPRNKGRKIPKSEMTEGARKGRLEVPTSANKKESTTRKKFNQDKLASKLKDKLNGGLASRKVEDRVETDLGESGTGNSSLTEEVSTLDIDHKGVMEQFIKPRNAWVLCDDCHKWRRIQATLADQIEESNCRWTCKDNMDKNFADCSVAQEKSNAEINAELDISDASCDEDACDARRKSNQSGKKQSADAQQSKWKLIRSNLFLHRNRKTQTIDEVMVCHCKAPSDGGMGCGDGCLNRMLNIECVRGTCPCGELCSNQQFQKRKYAKLECFKCGRKGFGLQGLDDISEGQFLIEYVGEVLDMHAYEARQKEYALNGHKHFYFMTLNGSEVIDACAKGNLGRFINHSCDPNCRTEKWMVNGEVCIGLFALRNIKKGEELTFDYNYVRVFGAAAKKCVCGSSQCRGYIGGDPQNAEVIVQDESDDDFPEPVMVCEDGLVDEDLNVTMPVRSSFGCAETMTAKKLPKDMDKLNESERIYKQLDIASEVLSAENEVPENVETDNSATAVGHVETIEESGDSLNRSGSAARKVDISVETEVSTGQFRSLDQPQSSLHPDDLSSEIVTIGEQECSEAQRSMKMSCSTAAYEENSPGTMVSKLSPDAMDSKRKLKSHIGKRRVKSSKSHPSTKASRPSSVKKEKPKGLPVNGKKLQEMQNKIDVLSCKSKKIVDGSSGGRFEAVQEKLSALLDHDGGISKRRDSSRGYLKLLLLTAASGDSGNGETIQSNRDLSMILDALLKTKSRTVLVDILNKNGLQMLHNMLKRYRKEFNKIPILRKLLKGFEYLATREILTSEHINGGPPCPGVESFRASILSFTEHTDRQVHQSARNFRDRWMPRRRKNNCMEWEESKMEFYRGSENKMESHRGSDNKMESHRGSDSKMESHRGSDSSRFPAHNHGSDRSKRHSETPDCITQPVVTSTTVDNGREEDSSFPSGSGGARIRKRKSRWDQPGDIDPRVEANISSDGKQTIDDDVPPGFAVPLNASVVPSDSSSNARCVRPKLSCDLKLEHETVIGHPQQRFLSRLPVSYGVPLCIAQQVGTPQPGSLEGWSIAPGMPFHPFPPLPSYPRHKSDPISNVPDSSGTEQDCNRSANHHSGVNPPSSSRASRFDVESPEEKYRPNFQQTRESSTLGRRFFRQQKWNNAKPCPPWIRNRNNWGPPGNNSRNGMYNVGSGNGTNDFRNSHGMEKANGEVDGSVYHHHHHQQPPQYQY